MRRFSQVTSYRIWLVALGICSVNLLVIVPAALQSENANTWTLVWSLFSVLWWIATFVATGLAQEDAHADRLRRHRAEVRKLRKEIAEYEDQQEQQNGGNNDA